MTKLKVLVPAIALLFATAIDARAVSLTLSGNAEASLEMDGAQAVYASDSNGVSQLITAVSMLSPDGGKISEVGVPSMMPDGRVIFGAEVQPKDTNIKARWTILVGNADAKPGYRLTAPLNPKALVGDCVPAFKGDPFPVADADGNIAFISRVPHLREALFVYSHGALSCLAQAGKKTNEGHEIAVLGFGSPQMGDDGQIAFNAFLADNGGKGGAEVHHQSLLLASKKIGIAELAVEGEYGPNHTEYMRPFGLPSAMSSPAGIMVAFTAKTPSGAALFLYSGGSMSRVLTTGTLTALGPVSFLSPGRPGLASDGTVAVLAGCARTPAIFRLSRQRLDLRISRGQLTPFGTELDSLGDPVLTASGAMFVGATDTDNHEKLYVLSRDDTFYEVGETELIYRIAMNEKKRHSIFTGTLTVNQHGDFGYLGGR